GAPRNRLRLVWPLALWSPRLLSVTQCRTSSSAGPPVTLRHSSVSQTREPPPFRGIPPQALLPETPCPSLLSRPLRTRAAVAHPRVHPSAAGPLDLPARRSRILPASSLRARSPANARAPEFLQTTRALGKSEIGRASCRERVYISVGGGAFKKKKRMRWTQMEQ